MLGHNRKMSGAECLADMLKGYGVTHIFHVPAVLRKTMAVMEGRTEIKRLHVHGEKAAAYMADGYARASGKPGICAAQVIGALNLAAGLRDAWLAHSPVIAMTGGREPRTKFRKVYQEVDDLPAFEPVTKLNATIDDVARFPDMVRQAFRVATSGTPGPVHLQFRGNEGQVDAEEADMEPLCEPRFARVPPYRPAPDDASVQAALERMLSLADKASAAKRKAWVGEAQGICKEWYAKYQPLLASEAVPIRPERICAELSRHVPDDGIVVVDTGHGGMWMGGLFDLR